jgi:site-specific DNA-methyltransferase (adenine-specific)
MDGFVVPEGLRNYQQMAEYILMYTFQDETGLSKIMGNCVYPIRDYIRSEIIRAKGKIILGEINRVLGTADNGGGVASACLSLDKTCPAMITEEHYLKLREWLNKYIEDEYLRKEYEDLRFTFNNQKTHHSVWNYDLVSKKDNHITPKPIELIKNIILHSSKEGQIVLDCFMGTGTVALACKQLNRSFIGCDNCKEYVELANRKLEQNTLNFMEVKQEAMQSEARHSSQA